jgi:hypothetical protein
MHTARRSLARSAAVALALLAALSGSGGAQTAALDTIRAGRFDAGKMWTFEYAPAQYFSETYGFTADSAWFARARLAALRIPGCSASFVSPNGLIATNHHCARGGVAAVSRPGENLLDNGFYAPTLEEERRVPRFYADQLIAIEDVSDSVLAALDRARTDEERAQARRTAFAAAADRVLARHRAPGDSLFVQMVSLYNGGRFSAYVFRRYTDIRLVVAPELQLGFFGGDPDNFTYPRYDLDFTILRIYGPDSRPLRTENWFRVGAGVRSGDAVFVIGNPGPTSRMMTMSQLEFLRDVSEPATVGFLRTRLEAMRGWYEANREEGERLGMRNRMFGVSNSLKASAGGLGALNDPAVMARKRDAERQLRDSIQARRDLRDRYGRLFDRLAALQTEKRRIAPGYTAFANVASSAGSVLLRRAYYAGRVLVGPADSAGLFRARLAGLADQPQDLERRLLALQLGDFARALGPGDEVTRLALAGRSAEDAAQALLEGSVLADSLRTAQALAAGALPQSDPGVALGRAFAPRTVAFARERDRLGTAEAELVAQLGRARFEVYGTRVPPDATFSLRITDGVVQGYAYNGTLAPPFTTFAGLYDRWFSFGPGSEWELPPRWRTPPAGLDLATPLDFCSTADTYGGNSGSPAVTKDLELVGLNFDRNIDALGRDFIYLPEQGRNVMVDVRAILASLDKVYGAHRVLQELRTGRLVRSEQEADAGR